MKNSNRAKQIEVLKELKIEVTPGLRIALFNAKKNINDVFDQIDKDKIGPVEAVSELLRHVHSIPQTQQFVDASIIEDALEMVKSIEHIEQMEEELHSDTDLN